MVTTVLPAPGDKSTVGNEPPQCKSLPAPSLKRHRYGAAEKLLCAMGHRLHDLVHPHHRYQDRHVHFKEDRDHCLLTACRDRPTTTPEEKREYHYSLEELQHMLEIVRMGTYSPEEQAVLAEKDEQTILQQGFLYFPQELHLFHHKRYYCLLQSRQMFFYPSAEHAARRTHLKAHYTIHQVIDCQMMSKSQKVAIWGAHWPSTMPLMFFIVEPNGNRVLVAAESRAAKRNWFHALSKLNYADCHMRRHGTYTTGTAYVVGACEEHDEEESDCKAKDDDTVSTTSSSPEGCSAMCGAYQGLDSENLCNQRLSDADMFHWNEETETMERRELAA